MIFFSVLVTTTPPELRRVNNPLDNHTSMTIRLGMELVRLMIPRKTALEVWRSHHRKFMSITKRAYLVLVRVDAVLLRCLLTGYHVQLVCCSWSKHSL